MPNTTTATNAVEDDAPVELGVVDSFRQLADAGKALAIAEADRARIKGKFLLAAGQRIAILGAVALVVALALAVTLLVGLMLCLEPLIGIGLALLTTVIVALLVLGLLGLGIMAQVKQIKAMP